MKKIKPNYGIIPLITIAIASLGSFFTTVGIKTEWYAELILPSWAPVELIGFAWTTIFILTTISALIVWNKFKRDKFFWIIISTFLINGVLNVLWCYIFFFKQQLFPAIFESALLGISVLILIILIYPKNKKASLLLLPYLLWVTFATYLTYAIWSLN